MSKHDKLDKPQGSLENLAVDSESKDGGNSMKALLESAKDNESSAEDRLKAQEGLFADLKKPENQSVLGEGKTPGQKDSEDEPPQSAVPDMEPKKRPYEDDKW